MSLTAFSRYTALALALIAVPATAPAQANLRNLVELCSSTRVSASEVVRACQNALRKGRLEPRTEAQIRTNLGAGLFDMGRFGDAEFEYTHAIRLDPGLMAAYVNRARAYERLNRLRDAVADYNTVIERDRNAADAYLGRGALLLRHGDPQRAVTDLSTAIRLQPGWTEPRFNRGMAYLQLADYGAAIEDFTVVIGRDSEDAGAYLYRGQSRAAQGDRAARDDFDQAVRLAPEWASVWYARGRFLDGLGQREAANADLLKAYNLGYQDPWLVERVREISG